MKTYLVNICIFNMALALLSCSSDHSTGTVNNTPDAVTLAIDGVTKSFTNVEVVESTFIDTNEDETVPTYNVLATPEPDNGEFVAFQVRRDYTGAGGLYQFIYNDGQVSHSYQNNFSFSLTRNSGNVLEGTFSGPLYNASGAETPSVTVTNGSFSIHF